MTGGRFPLFDGPHLASFRFERALAELDLAAACRDAPPEWAAEVEAMAAAVGDVAGARADLPALVRLHGPGWPVPLERAWQRLVGRLLDGHGIPGVLGGEPAAAFLLRGDERDRAVSSLARHLSFHPADPVAWEVQAGLVPFPAAARCAFHGGPVLPAAEGLAAEAASDGLDPPGPWLVAYGYLLGFLGLADVEAAVRAVAPAGQEPLALPGDGRAFTALLLEAERTRLAAGGPTLPLVEIRRRMKLAGEAAFRRYLSVVG